MELQPQAGLPLGRELADQLLELVTISTGKSLTLFPVPAVQAYLASMSMPMFASLPLTECGWSGCADMPAGRQWRPSACRFCRMAGFYIVSSADGAMELHT
jgi:hypothetical protein